MLVNEAATSLIWRVAALIILFTIISGWLGPRIIGSDIFERDGFEIYGSLGKATIFGLVAFLLLSRRSGHLPKLRPVRLPQIGWLLLTLSATFLASYSVDALVSNGRNWLWVVLAHSGIGLSVVSLLPACFGMDNLRAIVKSYRLVIVQSGVVATMFLIFLELVYAIWMPLASVVLVCVKALLSLAKVVTEVVPPNILVTDKFGVTIAEYCSGVESIALFTGLYVVVGLIDFNRLNMSRYLSIFPFALLGLFGLNILRVFGLITAGYYYDPEIAFSLFHSYAGMIFFMIYSVAFWLVAYKYIVNKPGDKDIEVPRVTTQPPNKIVISHVYSSDNKGDAALTSVLVDDIRRKFPDAQVTILSLEMTKPGRTFEGVSEETGFMGQALCRYKSPLVKLLYSTYMILVTLLWASLAHKIKIDSILPSHLQKIANIYEESDLIVPVGGGYIRSRSGLVNRLNIPLLLHPLLFGYLLGKPTILYSQSVGPFQDQYEKKLTTFVLRRMSRILIREDRSVELLRSMGVDQNVFRAVDSGFLLKANTKVNLRQTYNIPKKRLLLGVTVRSWLSGEDQIAYEKSVAKALDQIIKTSRVWVIFIPQVTAAKGDDDRITARRVRDFMKQSAVTVVEDMPDHHQIKAMYDDLDILLGTRFHSVIFSLTSFVPVVAIEYEHKTSGIMHDLGLSEWVIPIEEVAQTDLTQKMKILISKSQEYKRTLKEVIPPYQARAQEAAELMSEAYFAAATQTSYSPDDSVVETD